MQTAAVRPPAVAGQFYPADPEELRAVVDEHLEAGLKTTSLRPPKAIIAPHAGFAYSGPVAGSAFRTLEQIAGVLDRIVLIGPSHRVAFEGVALPGVDAFETPLGEVPVDVGSAATIADLPQVVTHSQAHAGEHSLEVELPFLQEILPQFKVVPLVVGSASADQVGEVLDRLWGNMETAIVVSSDLSHYLPYDEAREADQRTADRILAQDATLAGTDACGATAINGLLRAGQSRGLVAKLIDLRSSGDTSGDRDAVVGYGAFAFLEP